MAFVSNTKPFWPCRIVIRKQEAKRGAMDKTREYKYSKDVGKDFSDKYLSVANIREYRLIYPETGFPNRTVFLNLMEIPPGEATCLHRHDCEEVFYILEGKGEVIVEDKKYTIEKGDGVYVPPNARHKCINTHSSEDLKYTVSGGVMLHPLPSSPEEAKEAGAYDVMYPDE